MMQHHPNDPPGAVRQVPGPTPSNCAANQPVWRTHEPQGDEQLAPMPLNHLLGGPASLLANAPCAQVSAIHLELQPGDVLYTQGSTCRYAYFVEAGLLQRERKLAALDTWPNKPGAVSFAGTAELLGWQEPQAHRTESVTAVCQTRLLALPSDELQALESSSALVAELIARPLSLALMRNWRLVFRLSELPPDARVLAACTHLARLALAGESTQPVRLSLSCDTLQRWLDLPREALRNSLAGLQQRHALYCDGDRVTLLNLPALLKCLDD